MDYDFTYDDAGRPIVELEMGQETTAQWLNRDVFTSAESLNQILLIISDLQTQKIKTHQINTRSFEVSFTRDEVDIVLVTGEVFEDELSEEDGLEIYDNEQSSGCGLADLLHILQEWQAFHAEA